MAPLTHLVAVAALMMMLLMDNVDGEVSGSGSIRSAGIALTISCNLTDVGQPLTYDQAGFEAGCSSEGVKRMWFISSTAVRRRCKTEPTFDTVTGLSRLTSGRWRGASALPVRLFMSYKDNTFTVDQSVPVVDFADDDVDATHAAHAAERVANVRLVNALARLHGDGRWLQLVDAQTYDVSLAQAASVMTERSASPSTSSSDAIEMMRVEMRFDANHFFRETENGLALHHVFSLWQHAVDQLTLTVCTYLT